MSNRTSLLYGSVWKTQSDERRASTLAEAQEARNNAFSDFVILVDDQCEDIAEQHQKPVDAVMAETTFLTQLTSTLSGNGSRITTMFTGAQVLSDEQTLNNGQAIGASQARIDALEASERRLQAEAHQASDLRAELQIAERDLAAREATITELREQLRVATEYQQSNPLQDRVTELEGEVREANTAKEVAEAERDAANERATGAENSANHWHQQAVALGYSEPAANEEPQPESEEPQPESEPVTEEHTAERGGFLDSMFSRVPGHRRQARG